MKLNELKHDHSLTELLKILIFSLLMLAPLLASVSQMLYATFNKNAYQSYSGNKEELTEQLGLNYGITYYYEYVNNTEGQTNNTTSLIKIDYLSLSMTEGTEYIRFTNGNRIMMYDTNEVLLGNLYDINNVYYKVSRDNTNNLIQQPWFKNYQVNYVSDNLDNAFYYGVDQMTKSDLFNWTQNTALYSGIYGMTSNLEIQTPAIAILLTYWTILTIIYVIIDIVLKGFTYMTHFLQMKV